MEMEDCLMRPGKKVGFVERTKPKKKMGENRDTGYAWVVVIAACVINFIIAGMGRMSGILYVAFIERFGITRKEATKPFTYRSSFRNILGPMVGIFGQQYGVRPITLIGGILGAISTSACYFAPDINWISFTWGGVNGVATALSTTLSQVVIGQYFEKHHATASGIAVSGGCIGSFLFPVLLEYLLHTYGIQGTFLIIGGIAMNVIPAAMILRRPYWLSDSNTTDKTEDDGVEIDVVNDDITTVASLNTPVDANSNCNDKKSNSFKTEKAPDVVSDLKPQPQKMARRSLRGGGFVNHFKIMGELFVNPLFLLICFCRAVHHLTFVPVVTVVVDFGMDKGLSEADGKYTIAALSAGDLIGRLCFGWVTDRKFITLQKYMLFMMIVQGASTVCLPLLHTRAAIMTMIAVFGMLAGSTFVRHPVLVSHYMGENEQSIAMGCINFFSGLLGFVLPYFIGYFRDNLGSYDYVFYITGAAGSAISLLWLFEPYLAKFSRRDLSEEST